MRGTASSRGKRFISHLGNVEKLVLQILKEILEPALQSGWSVNRLIVLSLASRRGCRRIPKHTMSFGAGSEGWLRSGDHGTAPHRRYHCIDVMRLLDNHWSFDLQNELP